MTQRVFKVLILVLAAAGWLFLNVPVSIAGEVRVVDGNGLTRAWRNAEGAVRVVVVVRAEKGGANAVTLMLRNLNGVVSDIAAVPHSGGGFMFEGVSEGTWRIQMQGGGEISQVRIEK